MPGYAYLKDVLTRLPTQRASEIGYLKLQKSAWTSPQPLTSIPKMLRPLSAGSKPCPYPSLMTFRR